MNRSYKIISYDPKWPVLFSEESEKISNLIDGNILEIHHVGSTSVTGMSGKATVDILFVVKDISRISDHIFDMERNGYISLGSRNSNDSLLFEKVINGDRIFIVHFYQKNHPEIFQIIAIRDYLRTHKDKADEYSEFKLALFKKFPDDYSQYRKLKNEYIKKLISEVM